MNTIHQKKQILTALVTEVAAKHSLKIKIEKTDTLGGCRMKVDKDALIIISGRKPMRIRFVRFEKGTSNYKQELSASDRSFLQTIDNRVSELKFPEKVVVCYDIADFTYTLMTVQTTLMYEIDSNVPAVEFFSDLYVKFSTGELTFQDLLKSAEEIYEQEISDDTVFYFPEQNDETQNVQVSLINRDKKFPKVKLDLLNGHELVSTKFIVVVKNNAAAKVVNYEFFNGIEKWHPFYNNLVQEFIGKCFSFSHLFSKCPLTDAMSEPTFINEGHTAILSNNGEEIHISFISETECLFQYFVNGVSKDTDDIDLG